MKHPIGESTKAEKQMQTSEVCRGIEEDCRILLLSRRRSYPINSRMFSPDPGIANRFKHPLRRG